MSKTPFVIQLKYPTGEAKQDITIGIDAGYSKIGYCAITASKELIAGELELRSDIKSLLERRRTYRQNRKWYRKWVRIVTKTVEIINANIQNVELLNYGKGVQWCWKIRFIHPASMVVFSKLYDKV